MFKTILVPSDGDASEHAAAPVAEAIARATGGSLIKVHVSPGQEWLGSNTRPAVGELGSELGPTGLGIGRAITAPSVAEGVVAEAVGREADLIVMATHGRAGVDRILHGSVAEGVLRRSPVPVLLVGPRDGPIAPRIGRLLVPVDGTPGGAMALEDATELARAASATVILLMVAIPDDEAPLPSFPSVATPPSYREDTGDDAIARARRYVEELAAALRREGVTAEPKVGTGDVAAAIVGTADSAAADLIVMSTHALTGPARTLLGSVADAVVRTAHRPVLLIKRSKRGLGRAMANTAMRAAQRDIFVSM